MLLVFYSKKSKKNNNTKNENKNKNETKKRKENRMRNVRRIYAMALGNWQKFVRESEKESNLYAIIDTHTHTHSKKCLISLLFSKFM